VSPAGAHNVGWVFANSVGLASKGIGEAAAHEAGHTLGLHHDGFGANAYAMGSAPWAPIMGAGYYQPVTQWSRGEYAGATNHEDDLAIIGSRLPVIDDDHGDTAATATALRVGHPEAGRITRSDDVDAFAVDVAGEVTVTVASPSPASDLDVRLQVLDGSGRLMATVDPPARAVDATTAAGLDATWTGTPAVDGPLTFLVTGAGAGDPATIGGYSAYASLGTYEITVTATTTAAEERPLTLATPPLTFKARATVRRQLVATGGVGGYVFTSRGLPGGLRLDSSGLLSGRPTRTGRYIATVTAASGDQHVARRLSITVSRRPR
jgi:hypothetical protein